MSGLGPFRQLKWRIVAAHMVVVIVGVTVILLMARVTTQYLVPASVQARVADLAEAQDPEAVARATTALLDTFRNSIFTAVLVAALGAIVAGLISGLMLARQILRPLQEIASSSQRIADGRYSERVAVPGSDELAVVATHFNQMAQALEEVEEQRIRLIGNVAHELRTPLTALSGYLEGLMDGLFPSDPETFADMYQEVRRLQRLVDDLQALSRVESGRISLKVEAFALRPVVERVVSQLRPQAESKELHLATHYPDAPTAVFADRDRTAQVLVNLVGNAIRYTPEGGAITVRVETGERSADVLVKDTGIGIPAESLPYLFERFYRVDPSRSRRSGGSGIGLTIARHLAWAMGGDLTASSPGRDQGSTFTLTLPAADPADE
ncbi:MAG: HAMP domain-containing sensor histidine kinase [Candidatus Promineifilaceae bacterium]|nr:HAMP domain-containing sensor histidine kinase [Candidatus Promineifilaceae bacterium]